MDFKSLDEVLLSDVRQKSWAIIEHNGVIREARFKDLHKRMVGLTLNSTVPEDVRTGFDTARNLFLYSWFVYRFLPVAELQAHATLEYALGRRIAIEKAGRVNGLNKRFNLAVQRGWLRGEEIRRYQKMAVRRKEYEEYQKRFFKEMFRTGGEWLNPDTRSETEHAFAYLQSLNKTMPKLRNWVAHGTPMLNGGAALTLEICCDLINQLFPRKIEA